uniref:Rho GTPase-activating protein 39 n=1 Tax=Panagrolaimus superbus TaxID=310955 RepID=A0A914Z2R1_9BILA
MSQTEPDPQWIEIIDPQSRQRMFANLVTGHCAWEVPTGVAVRRMEANQWWELYDSETRRSYYYNPMTTQTIWQRPVLGDIIPLARLQALKQNTERGGAHLPEPNRPSSSSSTPRNRRRAHIESTTSLNPRNNLTISRTTNASNDFAHIEPSSSLTSRNSRDNSIRTNNVHIEPSSSAFRNSHDISHTANASNEFYANFCNDIASQLPDYPSGSGVNDTSFSSDQKKTRAPSTCSSRSQVSTKSTSTKLQYNNCIQEMVTSQFAAPESSASSTPMMGRAINGSNFPRHFRDCSPTSSVSSCGQSTDILSQTMSTAFIPRDSSLNKPNQRQSAPPVPFDKSECWSKDGIKHALLDPHDKKLKKYASSVFKLIMSYMGDKKSKTVPEQTALSILELRQEKPIINDEIFLQIMKQLTENAKADSVRRGWELLGILLFFFTPENAEVKEKLSKFVDNNSDSLLDGPEVSISQYAKHCLKRLQAPINNLKPSINAITQARFHIFNPSKFGASLEELMEEQSHSNPDLKLPWIEITLIQLILENGGENTEGIFRIAADPEQLNTAMVQLDQNIKPRLKDCHVAAVLLKQWLRQLPTPLIPDLIYPKCLVVSTQAENACCIVDQLPAINRLVLAKLLQLLQLFCKEETVTITKMDVANLAMVFAPNILRCESDDPHVLMNNSRREMEFMKTLILHYDTTFVHSLE